jgi:hypothetical protein
MLRRFALPLLLAGLLAGCQAGSPNDGLEDTPPTNPPPAEMGATDAPPAGDEPEPAATAEVRNHDLTVEEVRRYARAAEAIHEVAGDDEQARELAEDLETRLARAADIDEVQQILDEHPRVQEALRAAGISTRDYVVTGTALMGAYSYIVMTEMGVPDAYRPDYVSDAHIAFVHQNRADVDAVVARLQELYGGDFFDDFD